jgi:hypothetical protein
MWNHKRNSMMIQILASHVRWGAIYPPKQREKSFKFFLRRDPREGELAIYVDSPL